MNRDTIIIADDVAVNRAILVRALQEKYNIVEAADGKETIKLISENLNRLAVILMDIKMPHIDGLQIMNLMNKKNYTKKIPIIIITGDTSEETMRMGY